MDGAVQMGLASMETEHMTTGVAVIHPEWGIFLGCAMGLAFWSALDCAGQDCAPVMVDESQARAFIDQLRNIPDRTVFTFHPVEAVEIWATIEELDAAGLSEWTGPMKAERMGEAMGGVQ